MDQTTAIIIDDVAESRDLLKKTLREFSCKCIGETEFGKKAINLIRERTADIVFLDLELPDYPGIEVLRDIERAKLHDNVWIVSGKPKSENLSSIQELGARGYIQKPFKPTDIQKALENFHAKKGREFILSALIVDDDEDIRKILRKHLFSTGYFCDTKDVASAREAISYLQNTQISDITFIDIEMPEINGIQLLKFIVEKNIPTYPVVISAHSNFENVKKAIEAGSKGFLVKPLELAKIEEIIEGYLKVRNK